jgi:ATP-dependent Clp protease ATP-binding subunit ClpC
MFERYTEKARRAIFFARYEAGMFGSIAIETEHILLGLIREDKSLTARFFQDSYANVGSIRGLVERRIGTRDQTPSQIDLPLSAAAKRALAFAAEESDRLGHRHIGSERLLLGLLREEESVAAGILYERGLRLADARRDLIGWGDPRQAPSSEAAPARQSGAETVRPATQKLSVEAARPTDRDERWATDVLEACLDTGLFTQEELSREMLQVMTLRQFEPDVEALLRLLAEKGSADPHLLPKLALDLRDEKKLAEFIEKLRAG